VESFVALGLLVVIKLVAERDLLPEGEGMHAHRPSGFGALDLPRTFHNLPAAARAGAIDDHGGSERVDDDVVADTGVGGIEEADRVSTRPHDGVVCHNKARANELLPPR
jgi:hypothetical protein